MLLLRLWNRESLGLAGRALVLGALVAAAGLIAAATPAGEALEKNLGLAGLFAARGPLSAPADAIVVAIDEQSARDLGLPSRPSSWPRSLHTELVRYLAKAGARVVAFDLVFDSPGLRPEQDQAFADAIGAAGNVLLAESIRRETLQLEAAEAAAPASAVIESRSLPIGLLHNAARGSAPFMLPKDARVDLYWTFLDEARRTPTLPVLAFRVFSENASSSAAAAQRHPADVLLDLYTSAGSRYLNFYGPPRTVATVSYSDVLKAARRVDAGSRDDLVDRFKGKGVFVGYAATTPAGQDRLRDDYRTVYSQDNGLDLSGVEIAATAFANLVEGRAVRPVGLAWQLGIVAIWGLMLGAICRLARPVLATLVVLAASAAYLSIALWRFTAADLWLPTVTPVVIEASLAMFAGVWLNYRDSGREREGIKRAFGFFLPRHVVDQLSRNLGPVTRANQVLFGACLATDAEQYTSLAEQTEPGRLGELMNEYYSHLFVPVERSKGVVADVVGDSMVAVWARTSSDIDVRRSACAATLEIAKSLEDFNNPGRAERLPLPTRFGLHSGDMLFGNIGASGHYEYRAVGDIVNTASRIQGLNKILGTRILATAETVEGLDEFVVRPLGSFLLAGKAKAVDIVELIGKMAEGGPAHTPPMCAEFASGLDAFTERRWHDAARAFAAILSVRPDDGPARFYAERCHQLALDPPGDTWSPTIRIASK